MSDRIAFFGADADFDEACELAVSTDSSDRWLAAVQLGQIKTLSSAEILWRLREDTDESTRLAATNALRGFDSSLTSSLSNISETLDGLQVFGTWKVRPLPKLESATKEAFAACVMDLLATEGPTTGSRIYRLLCQATAASSENYPSRTQVRDICQTLVVQSTICRVDKHFDSDRLDQWILNVPGFPDFQIRNRGTRELNEIPVNEAQAVLRDNPRFLRRPDPNIGFQILTAHYEITQSELFKIGEVLENQWQGLFQLP